MCKFLLERCRARKDRTLETTLYVLISYMGVDLRFLGLNGFHPDTVGHGGFQCFSLFLHLQWFGVIIDLHFIFSLSYGLLPQFFFQVPCASVEHCKAQLSIFAQVDDVGNAWVAGYTESSLDGHTNAGESDIFLMKFDAQGVHLWTRQRGGESWDYAFALQADGVRLRFRTFSMEEKHGKTLDPLARSMFWVRWNGITFKWINLLGALTRFDITISHISRISRSISWKFERLL